ncbi:hypothetical protein RKE25_04945 [Dyella sp. BiH032]|uniref:hypothetical protein n=1 Tax=Dyella sp. BiH032 TaxID=3075430 RepID=UPI002892B544|nr:hypothetical protein [Dyella sp. BiH032]WNL46989.1 hypothetical protein RKE25_04945 [Dyella sp. BiH032]
MDFRKKASANLQGPLPGLCGLALTTHLNPRSFSVALRVLLISLIAASGLSLPAHAGDGGDKVATQIAESWLGHDASELLTQWPIDKGYRTYELESSNETAYSFYFGIDAYSYSHDVYDGQQMVAPGVIQQNYHEEVVNVPRQDHCFITFYANAEGIIARYEYSGVKCRPYLKSWGKPKNS